jgi:hypothetical protein
LLAITLAQISSHPPQAPQTMMTQVTLRVLAALLLASTTAEGRLGGGDVGASRQLQKVSFLEIVGQGELADNPLGVCQGDCDSDKDVSDRRIDSSGIFWMLTNIHGCS